MLRFGRFDKFHITIALVILVVAGGALYWQDAAERRRAALDGLQERLAEDGWRLNFAAAETAGFPGRLDLALRDVKIAPDHGLFHFGAPRLDAKALIYRPDYLALTAPPGWRLDTPVGGLAALDGNVLASLAFEPSDDSAGDGGETLARLSVSGADLAIEATPDGAPSGARPGEIGLAELHLRPDPNRDSAARRAFLRLDGLRIPSLDGATLIELRLDGSVRFAASPGPATPLPALESIALGDAAAPGLTMVFPDAALSVSGTLERRDGQWRGLLGFESDAAPAALERLRAFGLLSARESEQIGARVAASGRLAGVLSLGPAGVEILDIQPEPIPIETPAPAGMERYWKLE